MTAKAIIEDTIKGTVTMYASGMDHTIDYNNYDKNNEIKQKVFAGITDARLELASISDASGIIRTNNYTDLNMKVSGGRSFDDSGCLYRAYSALESINKKGLSIKDFAYLCGVQAVIDAAECEYYYTYEKGW